MNSLNSSSNFLQARNQTKDCIWIDKRAAAKLLSLSVHTLKIYRQKHWQCGIHFQYLNSRAIRCHRKLLINWQVNSFYIAAYLKSN